jgi:hypothetical protein
MLAGEVGIAHRSQVGVSHRFLHVDDVFAFREPRRRATMTQVTLVQSDSQLRACGRDRNA